MHCSVKKSLRCETKNCFWSTECHSVSKLHYKLDKFSFSNFFFVPWGRISSKKIWLDWSTNFLQLLKTNRSKSLSLCEDLRYSTSASRSAIGSLQSPTPPVPMPTRISSRKRGNRTASLGSSSDEGSLMNLSMSSNEGKANEGCCVFSREQSRQK